MIRSRQFRMLLLLGALCLVVRGQGQSPTPKTPAEPTTGTISGRVITESGQPLAGAALSVRSVNSIGTGRSTSTDIEGNFVVNGLAPGLYTVSAYSPPYTLAPSDPDTPQPYYRIGDSVRLQMFRGGAITGSVTNSLGEPVIAVRVRATMVRDARGQVPKLPSSVFLERPTDDRGIYRIYGLSPGTYLVSAGGAGFSAQFNPYETDIPTFAPSSTRDTAAEVIVRTGEDTNVDIRYRGEPGHTISGTVKLTGVGSMGGVSINLTPAGSSLPTSRTIQLPGSRGFAFNGLADGDYDLVAQEVTSGQTEIIPQLAFSETKRVTVRGANVTGIELITRPLALISGRISLEPSKAPECQGKRPPLLAETLVQLQRPEKEVEKDDQLVQRMFGSSASPDATSNFVLRNMTPGRYQFAARFYARYWYLQSITLGTIAGKPQNAAAGWTTVKSGDRLTNLIITLAEGAASIRGRVPVAEGASLPAGMVVYLIPSEPDKADDVFRFFVTEVAVDGTFSLNNLPPGRYLALTQTTVDPQIATATKLRQPEAAAARAKLRRAAETKKAELELKPCQNLNDYQLKQ
jgi:hypothetical protein